MTPLADLAALSARLGMALDEHEAEGERAQAALEDASALVRSESGKDWLDEHDDLVLDLPEIIAQVTLAAAYRAFRNPDGTAQASVGDVSVSYSRDGAAGSVFLTRAERRAVRKAGGVVAVGSLTLQTPYLQGQDPLYTSDGFPLGPLPWEA